jgi:hypothetical protein
MAPDPLFSACRIAFLTAAGRVPAGLRQVGTIGRRDAQSPNRANTNKAGKTSRRVDPAYHQGGVACHGNGGFPVYVFVV